jgi:hypothetical protein
LRSLADSKTRPIKEEEEAQKPTGMTIVRYGIPIQAQSH